MGDSQLGALMAIETPQLQWPFRINSQGTALAFVEQDTSIEVAQCVALLFTARPGDFTDDPEFGLPDPTFETDGVSESELESVVSRWEPRAELNFTGEQLVDLLQTFDVNVGVGEE